ncbi:MAG: cytidine deaminase [Ruminococcaceae bacterium]|nr:cytidine deaminase [Oscillospiraceae bacterium]
MTSEKLIEMAKTTASNAYAPYSDFCVGAALLCKNGKVYTGCNIENSSFSPTNCAERTAFFKAISEGERDFEAIAIVGGKNLDFSDFCYPCGVCRQVMSEFCKGDFRIILGKADGEIIESTLSELLPNGFSSENLR